MQPLISTCMLKHQNKGNHRRKEEELEYNKSRYGDLPKERFLGMQLQMIGLKMNLKVKGEWHNNINALTLPVKLALRFKVFRYLERLGVEQKTQLLLPVMGITGRSWCNFVVGLQKEFIRKDCSWSYLFKERHDKTSKFSLTMLWYLNWRHLNTPMVYPFVINHPQSKVLQLAS